MGAWRQLCRKDQAVVHAANIIHEADVMQCAYIPLVLNLLTVADTHLPGHAVQEMNLRDLTKKLGRNKGLNVDAVQLFACQLIIALR
jgi:hypothetical protein